jgi:hypothetical protein
MTTRDTPEAAPEGPYCNDDGEWWVPVEGIPFKKARALVLGCAYDGRLAYLGKEMQWLDSEHEGHDGDDGEDCPSNRYVLAYHFEERCDD